MQPICLALVLAIVGSAIAIPQNEVPVPLDDSVPLSSQQPGVSDDFPSLVDLAQVSDGDAEQAARQKRQLGFGLGVGLVGGYPGYGGYGGYPGYGYRRYGGYGGYGGYGYGGYGGYGYRPSRWW